MLLLFVIVPAMQNLIIIFTLIMVLLFVIIPAMTKMNKQNSIITIALLILLLFVIVPVMDNVGMFGEIPEEKNNIIWMFGMWVISGLCFYIGFWAYDKWNFPGVVTVVINYFIITTSSYLFLI